MKARAAATPIALVALAAGAAAYAYLVDRGTVSDAERIARLRDVFPSFRVDEVSRVEIAHGRDKFALERDNDPGLGAGWAMASGRRQRVDAAAVDALLRELELATRLRDVTEPAAALGLDAPRAQGKVKVGTLEYRFEVGSDAPLSEGGAYMRVDGEGTFVVSRSLKVQLLRGADAYRDRALVPLGAREVGRIDVRAGDGGGFGLERSGTPFDIADSRLRASRSAVGQIFTALADARAESFLDEAVARELTSAGITVTLAPREERYARVELHIGGACPGQPDGVVLLRTAPSPTAACIAKALVEALSATAGSLVDLSPLFAQADEIEQVRMEGVPDGGVVVDLARKGSGWHQRSPEDRDLDVDESDSANNLALALANARAISARPTLPGERLAIHARVTIVRTGGGNSEVVEIATTGADGVTLVHRVDDGAILRLPRAVAQRFEAHPVALRAPIVWRPPFDAGAVVAVDDGCTPVPERLELRSRNWTMDSPAGFAADPPFIADLVGAISHAKADSWVAEGDDGTFGFDSPASCTITLTLAAGLERSETRRVSLVFGAEGDGGVYAHTLADPAVFVAPKSVRDLASRLALDRSRLRLDPGAIASVILVRGGTRWVLNRVGEHLTRVGPEHDAAEGDDRLETALASFYAQAAIHTGPPAPGEGMDTPTLEIATSPIDGGARETRLAIGALGHVGADEVYFVRASGIDATFIVPRRVVGAIFDAW